MATTKKLTPAEIAKIKKKLSPAERKKFDLELKKQQKKPHAAGEFLDMIGWGVREMAMPVPTTLIKLLKKKRKK